MSYDSKSDTLEHIKLVSAFLNDVIHQLLIRAENHDKTKLESPEKQIFDEWTPKLAGSTYGSEEYNSMLEFMNPALKHHYAYNRHHPEHYSSGIHGMNLIDLIEMLCDWKAATLRHDNGNIKKSLEINKKRFNIPSSIVEILNNTINDLCWDNQERNTLITVING